MANKIEGKSIMMIAQTFRHKGFTVDIRCEEDYDDPTTVKAYHHIYNEQGDELLAPIDSYDTSRKTVELFIDAGFPKRTLTDGTISPHDRASLTDLLNKRIVVNGIWIEWRTISANCTEYYVRPNKLHGAEQITTCCNMLKADYDVASLVIVDAED